MTTENMQDTAIDNTKENTNLLDDLETQVNAIESAIDNVTNSEENNTEGAGENKPEEAPNFASRIEALENDNKRLVDLVSRLIVVNGARINSENSTQGVEAFPPSSVEDRFKSDNVSAEDVIRLKDIVLGS